MSQKIRDVMSQEPITLGPDSTVIDAAQAMRDSNVGDVIVLDGDDIGILTDRDIAVRAVAEGLDPRDVQVTDICSRHAATLAPDDSVERAAQMMREHAVRRLPVVEQGKPIGIVSLGDLAIEGDSGNALADISAARPNN
jgi:CBS domain-containing protein